MQLGRPNQVQAEINVTPLVDVVLVLLIVFMVVAPQLAAGPAMLLPTTDTPSAEAAELKQIIVALEDDGAVWIDGDRMTAAEFPLRMSEAAEQPDQWRVVIKGDARLTFGEVRRAMFAIEEAGFGNVGLITEQREE